MFGRRFYGARFYGPRYFGEGANTPAADGSYMGARYFGPRFFGPRYFSPEAEAGVGLSITDITEGPTSIVVTWTGGTATHYRIDGGTATAMPDGTSPDTITGLTENTEYFSPGLELSGDGGSTWSTPVAFGTTNEGGSGGGIPLYIDGTVASAAASGLSATLNFSTGILAGVGSASAQGLQVSIALSTVVSGGVGSAAASGLTAAVNLGANIAIVGGIGAADASGLGAAVALQTAVAAGIGAAAASGLSASITVASGVTIAGEVGAAQASGLPATITMVGPITISAGVGSAEAVGLRAIVRALGLLPAYLEQPTTGASWSYKQTATLWRLVDRDEWGGQTTHELAGLFLCDHATEDRRARSAAGDEFTTRLMVYTSLPGVKQGDMILIGATNEADPYKAGAHEVLAVTAWADTFRAEGAPDYRIAT